MQGSGVEVVESCDYIRCVDIIVCGPAVVSAVVTLPLDKVFKTMPTNTAIEDLLNLEFLIILD